MHPKNVNNDKIYKINNFPRKISFERSGPHRPGTFYFGTSLALFGLFKKEQKRPLTEKEQVKEIVIRGILAKREDDVNEASKCFHDALTKSAEFYNDGKLTDRQHLDHRVFIYDELANLNLDAGNLQEAEALFTETMKLALHLGKAENDNAMIEMSLKLALIHVYTGRLKTGLIGLRYCISEQEKKLATQAESKKVEGETKEVIDEEEQEQLKTEEQNTKILLGKAYRHYATYHMKEQRYKEAKSLMLKALDIAKSTLGLEHDQTFIIMNDLAALHTVTNEYEEAEAVLREGLALSKKAESLMESALLSNLGALYIRTKRYEAAEKACQKALDIAKKGNDKFLMIPCTTCLEKLATLKAGNAEEEKK